ncbi:acyltransferase [Pseudoalteromonas luteoviolacea]|uniref:Acetyltransferase n=1 Tax=Pseudoalteromonas luteoviolacea NCIMB 1942 TaxID=1365253 RepID=A0A167GES4_9GAMM|nr:acyltransferase [Pseudoalteromonas luteoviolacea]KZN54989.1 hypothetical protein N482_05385 [Pseudoalteromonas luteoviolacea NCIMB 1942]
MKNMSHISSNIDQTANLKAEIIYISDEALVGENVEITAKEIHISSGCKVEDGTKINASGTVYLGDFTLIGANSIIQVNNLTLMDYSKLQRNMFMNGGSDCYIGYNSWIGSNCILNVAESLYIGNGVGIGTYSSVWTHGHHGELLEGCKIHKVSPVRIENDVWILGCYNVISPGVVVGEKALVMTGSIVTKDVPPMTAVGGNPAKPIPSLAPYEEVIVEDKLIKMESFIREFCEQFTSSKKLNEEKPPWLIESEYGSHTIVTVDSPEELENLEYSIAIVKKGLSEEQEYKGSVFDLSSKYYYKTSSKIEVKFIQFLLYEKARFMPINGHARKYER